jgi:hypothetical protein
MSAPLTFGMPLRQILYATCWIVTAVVFVKNIHFMSICGSIRLYAIFWTVSLATSLPALPRTLAVSFSALLISF